MTVAPATALARPVPWWAPAALVLVAGAGLVALAPGTLVASALLVGAYVATPLAKEAWVAAAPLAFGLPALHAALVLLAFELTLALVLVRAPVERLLARVPLAQRATARLQARVAEGRWARLGLATALCAALAVPLHSGGGIVGTLGGRALGLPPRHVVVAVAGAAAFRFSLALLAYHTTVALLA